MYIRHCRTGHFSVAHSVVWDHWSTASYNFQLQFVSFLGWASLNPTSSKLIDIFTKWTPYLGYHQNHACSWVNHHSSMWKNHHVYSSVDHVPSGKPRLFQPMFFSRCRPVALVCPRCLLHCTMQQTEEARETGGHPHDDGCGRLSSSWQTPCDQATKPDGLKIWILGYLRAPPNFTSLIISLTIQWPLHEYTTFLDGSEYHVIIRCIIHPTLYISTEFIPRKLL